MLPFEVDDRLEGRGGRSGTRQHEQQSEQQAERSEGSVRAAANFAPDHVQASLPQLRGTAVSGSGSGNRRARGSYWLMLQVKGTVAVSPWSALVARAESSWTVTM